MEILESYLRIIRTNNHADCVIPDYRKLPANDLCEYS